MKLRSSTMLHLDARPPIAYALGLALTMVCTAQSQAATIYVSLQGHDGDSGTEPSKPVRSLGKALALAGSGGIVKLGQGTFETPALVINDVVTLEGGWDATFATQKTFTKTVLNGLSSTNDLCASHTCITTRSDDRVMTIRKPAVAMSPASEVVLRDLVILGPDRSAIFDGSSYGLIADGGNVSLRSVVIQGGKAGTGNGGAGVSPAQGTCSRGGSAGWAASDYNTSGGDNYYCKWQAGGQGDSPALGTAIAKVGAGGAAGSNGCRWNPTLNYVSDGSPGGDGDQGIEGTAGKPALADDGVFVRIGDALHWKSAVSPAKGGEGTAGGGGGGGGPGGSWNVYFFWCVVPDNYGLVIGGRGRQGNPGGCGGHGGNGGLSGGGAFALVVNDAKVSEDGLVLFGGQGGKGGGGANGSTGAPGVVDTTPGDAGGSQSCAGATSSAGRGAHGGAGGRGGGGGGGGGGNGGPSFLEVKIGTGEVVSSGGEYRKVGGEGGKGGAGGLGADSRQSAFTGSEGLRKPSVTLSLK
jgi:hypothetical protein